jgi:hypothetical protein
VAPADGLGPAVALGRGEGDGVGASVGDVRATVWIGVDAAVVGAAEVAGAMTVSGAQAAAATIRATGPRAQNRRKRRFTVGSV